MSNLILTGRNWIDEATLSGGSWLPSLPLTNLQNQQPRVVARAASADAADTLIDADLGGPRFVGSVGIIWHTGNIGSQVRVLGGDDPTFASVSSDTGWLPLWPRDHDYGSRVWGKMTWGERIAPDVYPNLNRARYIVPLETTFARYWRFQFDVFGSNPFDVGRLVLADVFQPAINMDLGWQMVPLDDSRQDVSLGGQRYVDELQRRRRLDFGLRGLTTDEAWATVADLDAIKGVGGDVMAIPIPPTEKTVTGVAVAAGGSGYAAADLLTVQGGDGSTAAQIEVVTVDGSGAVTSAVVYESGTYNTAPTSPATVSGGSGTGATFTLTVAWRDPKDLHKQALYGQFRLAPTSNPILQRYQRTYSIEEMI